MLPPRSRTMRSKWFMWMGAPPQYQRRGSRVVGPLEAGDRLMRVLSEIVHLERQAVVDGRLHREVGFRSIGQRIVEVRIEGQPLCQFGGGA